MTLMCFDMQRLMMHQQGEPWTWEALGKLQKGGMLALSPQLAFSSYAVRNSCMLPATGMTWFRSKHVHQCLETIVCYVFDFMMTHRFVRDEGTGFGFR